MASGYSDRMKLFQFTQETYRDIGIFPPKPNQNRCLAILKKWFFIFCHVQYFIPSAAFLWFEANSMIEYEMASFTCTTIAASFILYLILFWKMKNIQKHIENCERFVENSEY